MTADQDGEADLRRRVDELEATVRGLTQELVEANERIRQLEDRAAPEEDPDFIEADEPTEEEEQTEPNAGVAPETAPDSETETDEHEGDEDETDDIIVA